ncbi:LysR family transcriptional regulator [Roseibium alexandrii]|uniref:LysR family transcriptional regulator n=1 Tax=Roseibium alexandrii TaxID=388408 RepID=UPI0037537F19
MDNLNYHHLRYFREVAHEGNLTRTAERVNLSQSAISTQIRQLEARLGHDLFERSGRQLVLTEVGRIVLDHADRIFGTGEELIATLQRSSQSTPTLRVGAQSTLSRNFQIRFLKPLLSSGEVDFTLRSGSASVLLEALESLALDIVLTTDPPDSSLSGDFTAHRLAEQKVTIHGTPERIAGKTLHQLLSDEPLIVPDESSIRTGFDSLVARLGIAPRIVADVDDMAMVRLLARADVGIAIAPPVVMADEIASGLLESAPFDLQIFEAFYAVTVTRSFPHPILRELLAGQMD